MKIKIFKALYIIGLLLPILNIISIYLLLKGAYEKLGSLPSYGDKNPFELGLDEQYHFAVRCLSLMLIPLILLVTLGVYFLITRRFPFNTNKIFHLISLLTLYIVWNLYDMDSMVWFWDD